MSTHLLSHRRIIGLCVWLAASLLTARLSAAERGEAEYDVVVYGGTSGGIIAAVQTARMGKSVVLIEPTKHLGGLTTGGLGVTDIGKRSAIGGLALEFYERVAVKYRDERNWPFQKRSEYSTLRHAGRLDDERAMWRFEPKVALEVYQDLLREHKIQVVQGERLDLKKGVRKTGTRITAVVMESGRVFLGKMFVDASYEGDVMAKAGVAYTIGREAAATYQESLAGITTKYVYPHQRRDEIDAYVVPGDPASGLLPTVRPSVAAEGAADPGIMAFCYRMCLTNHAANRLPIEKPADYDERNYELLLRSIEAGRLSKFTSLDTIPNHKTDCNSTEPFSTNHVGMNHAYPDADYATRAQIERTHKNHQLGFLWTLQHHPRVPADVRKTMLEWGLPKDEFAEYGHWSPQLYIREGRRMVSDFVMIQQHCEGQQQAPLPIGMASYTLDSHYVQRFVDARGKVQHEGYFDRKVQPYGVGYGALVPKKAQCENLLVPVCMSASHVAFGSIRMEPVFMILGQSAATAACLAIDGGVPIQDVSYAKLRERLLADKQTLPSPEKK